MNKLKKWYNKYRTRIPLRLTLQTVLFASVLSIIITFILLYQDYKKEIALIEAKVTLIKHSQLNSLKAAVWEFNEKQVKLIMNSIMEMGAISYIELVSKEKSLNFKIGKKPENSFLKKVLPLSRNNKILGNIQFYFDSKSPQDAILYQFWIIFLSQISYTFSIAFFILFLIRKNITLYLARIGNHLEKNIEEEKISNLDINKPYYGDEIDIVVKRINEYSSDLHESNTKLTYINENLEKIIEERTSALQNAQETLKYQAERRKQLIHILVHDLKNPVGISFSYLDLLKKHPDRVDNYIPKIRINIKKTLEIIDFVRNMLSVQDGKKSIYLERVNLYDAVKESLNMLQFKIKTKGIKIDLHVPKEDSVMAEKVSFVNTVINNLITNAIKFSQKGDHLIIKSQRSDDYITLSIKDHGIGIPDKLVNYIFDPHQKTTRNGTDGETGTGFGMPLVKEFINAYGGKIKLKTKCIENSPEDHGTEIKIILKKVS